VEIAGRKVAGVLVETGVDRAQAPFAVVGFGVNVNQRTTILWPS
jgi:biotin-(acetyl-CoA carboxylase) ligase